jgi:hypothetical protein
METTGNVVHHEPWNKGTIVGQKALFKVKDSGLCPFAYRWKTGFASPHSLILASTAGFADAT